MDPNNMTTKYFYHYILWQNHRLPELPSLANNPFFDIWQFFSILYIIHKIAFFSVINVTTKEFKVYSLAEIWNLLHCCRKEYWKSSLPASAAQHSHAHVIYLDEMSSFAQPIEGFRHDHTESDRPKLVAVTSISHKTLATDIALLLLHPSWHLVMCDPEHDGRQMLNISGTTFLLGYMYPSGLQE